MESVNNFFSILGDFMEEFMYSSQNIAENIRNLIKNNNVSIQEMLKTVNIGRNAMSHMDNGSMPKADNLAKIADYFNVSTDYLLGRTDNPEINKTPVIVQEPTNIIKIPSAVSKVSAGHGAYISDDYPDEIEIDANTYPKADFAVQITGDSMEPEYPNGKIVLVHKQTFLENGQIGIFMLNNEGYIKKYHFENGVYILMSLNSKYKNIALTMSDNFQIVGRVLYTL